MDAVVFVGPTLSREDVLAAVAADVRPPARAGDVLRACGRRPRFIGIIDGFFDRVPSVWHKEILYALEQGIRVVGGASMGALRAAELEAFGMEGVGTVFEAFRDGRLDGDDEVAVAHASEADRYRPLSEALVNMRATLGGAAAENVITADTKRALEDLAQRCFYPDRTYPGLLRAGRRAGLSAAELDTLEAWLPRGRVDAKRDDGLAVLKHIRRELDLGVRTGPREFRLAETDSWLKLRALVDAETAAVGAMSVTPGSQRDALIDELLAGGRCARVMEGALARALAGRLRSRSGAGFDARAVRASVDDFRRERGLGNPEAFEAWLVAQRIPDGDVDGFFTREAMVRRARVVLDVDLLNHLRDQMRAMDVYGELASRAEAKQDALVRAGFSSPTLADTGLTEEELWRWFFEKALGRPMPTDIDMYAAGEYSERSQLLAAAVREFCFVTRASAHPPAEPRTEVSDRGLAG